MKIEFNFVQTTSTFSTLYNLLKRDRVLLPEYSTSGLVEAFTSFVRGIDSDIRTVLADPTMLDRILNTPDLNISDIKSFKFLLTTAGLDIVFYEVAEDLTENADSIPAGMLEYNYLNRNTTVLPHSLKNTLNSKDTSVSEMYQDIMVRYGLMNKMPDNTLTANINTLQATEKLTGKVIPQVANLIEDILEYLGIQVVIIKS